jgi:hypothetical protein
MPLTGKEKMEKRGFRPSETLGRGKSHECDAAGEEGSGMKERRMSLMQ